jgi:rubrerythrin
LEEWWSLIAMADRWTSYIKRAKAACMAYRQATAQALVWEKSIENQLSADGALAELDKQRPIREPWTCEKCGMVFESKKALAVHATRRTITER